jgi:hypothetical protein
MVSFFTRGKNISLGELEEILTMIRKQIQEQKKESDE